MKNKCRICGKPVTKVEYNGLCKTHALRKKQFGNPYLYNAKQSSSTYWVLIDERLKSGETSITKRGRAYALADIEFITPDMIQAGKLLKDTSRYERFPKPYPAEEVLSKVILDMDKKTADKFGMVDFDGNMVNMASDRYKCFKVNGCSCVACGLTGTHFYLERTSPDIRFHFNLYAIDESGQERMITKDHIVPKSKGGKDTIDNYQTMCKECNERKGNLMETFI